MLKRSAHLLYPIVTMKTEFAGHASLILCALLLAALGSGCGGMLQTAYGFSKTEVRQSERSRHVRIEGVPAGAKVQRSGPDGTKNLQSIKDDHVTYPVQETVEVPRSRVPMYIGTALDVAGLGLTAYAASRGGQGAVWMAYSAAYFATGAVADGVFAIIYSNDTKTTVTKFEPVPQPPMTYTVRIGDETRVALLDPAWGDRVHFDFSVPDDVQSPGGPRIGAYASQPAPPKLELEPTSGAATPAPEVPERWYGWQIIPLDVLAITGMVVGFTKDNSALMWGSVGLFGAGPPLVHFANGQFSRGGGSFASRTVGPIVGAGIGFYAGLFAIPFIDCSGDDFGFCFLAGPIYGAAIGAGLIAVAAPFLDSGFLAWKPQAEEGQSETGLMIVPSTGVTDDGRMTFGLAGRF